MLLLRHLADHADGESLAVDDLRPRADQAQQHAKTVRQALLQAPTSFDPSTT